MYLGLTTSEGAYRVMIVHRFTATIFVATPMLYSLAELKSVAGFVKETLAWDRNDLTWLLATPGYYGGRRQDNLPAQGRINGDQKLWQLIVIFAAPISLITGVTMWFFSLNIPVSLYLWVLQAHRISFLILLLGFLAHFYLYSFQPRNDESLGSMVDGKISPSYAREHYRKWYDKIAPSDE